MFQKTGTIPGESSMKKALMITLLFLMPAASVADTYTDDECAPLREKVICFADASGKPIPGDPGKRYAQKAEKYREAAEYAARKGWRKNAQYHMNMARRAQAKARSIRQNQADLKKRLAACERRQDNENG